MELISNGLLGPAGADGGQRSDGCPGRRSGTHLSESSDADTGRGTRGETGPGSWDPQMAASEVAAQAAPAADRAHANSDGLAACLPRLGLLPSDRPARGPASVRVTTAVTQGARGSRADPPLFRAGPSPPLRAVGWVVWAAARFASPRRCPGGHARGRRPDSRLGPDLGPRHAPQLGGWPGPSQPPVRAGGYYCNWTHSRLQHAQPPAP